MARYLAITGGVGGAKLALGLAQILGPDELVFAVNTGDDFEHLGLHIAPDVDTLTYTLAGVSNTDTGWGRQDETWNFMDALERLGGETWFQLGDRDLALHVTRTQMLTAGQSLTQVTAQICATLGVTHPVFPMSDDPVRTTVHTESGPLAFQHYFVRDRCEPAVRGFEFVGIEQARLNPAITRYLEGPEQVDGIIIEREASLACLLGTLTAFYRKMGFERFQFRPAFFPYTEPSLEVFVWHEAKGDWVEMGGSGIFRPEVTRPFGCEVPVLAWGLGLERLAIFYHGIERIREIYDAPLDWLKETPVCRL